MDNKYSLLEAYSAERTKLKEEDFNQRGNTHYYRKIAKLLQ